MAIVARQSRMYWGAMDSSLLGCQVRQVGVLWVLAGYRSPKCYEASRIMGNLQYTSYHGNSNR
jgi:hypothetical protein